MKIQIKQYNSRYAISLPGVQQQLMEKVTAQNADDGKATIVVVCNVLILFHFRLYVTRRIFFFFWFLLDYIIRCSVAVV